MIKIHLVNFALIKDALEQKRMEIKMNNGATVGELLEKIRDMNKQKLCNLPIRAAVNQSYVDENYRLHNEDLVALIPPVSGG